jgi:hypothetical protein
VIAGTLAGLFKQYRSDQPTPEKNAQLAAGRIAWLQCMA